MSISDLNKQVKELQFLFDWLQIARKPKQNLRMDIKMIFDLICIPVSESELSLLVNVIDPNGQKSKLERKDFIDCFVIEEDCKKPKEKELIKAFRYVSGDKENVSIGELKGYFSREKISKQVADVIVGQLEEYVDADHNFDYKSFAGSIY